MRKSHIDSILVEHAKRRNFIIVILFLIVFVSVFAFSLFFMYLRNKEEKYITYDEKSNIFYKVYLKENDFFENDYLDVNKQYIASLIDKIIANFEYELSFDTDVVEYKYEYKIDANVKVYDKYTNNVFFSKTENLIPKIEKITRETNVNINENVQIDYNYFNDLIKKFVNVYDLDDAESVLTIDMTINTISICDDFVENEENTSKMTLTIPLTTKTVAIEMSNDLIETENNIMLCESGKTDYIILLIFISLSILDFVLVVCLIKFEIKTRTAETIYMKKFKKILNNYGAYIQEVTDGICIEKCQIIKIKTFEDLLEIRDTIKQPILMKQNQEKSICYFVIPSGFGQIYVYRLAVEDVEN